ncbi:MAG: SpoIIE family protein phosphatase [Nitrospirota bacterium]|nr:MAG: SpoIIE family protein phosphatase [Nitrospirota bacterium]
MRLSRLFTKALIIIVILFGLIALTSSILLGWNLYKSLTEEYESKGTAIAQSIADSSVEILLNRDASTIQAMVDQYLKIKGVSYVFVLDGEDEFITHTFIPQIPQEIVSVREDKARLDFAEQVHIHHLHIKGIGPVIDISAPILAGVAGHVHVGMDKTLIQQHIFTAILRQQGLLISIFVVVLALAYLLIRRISQPLQQLTAHANQLASFDFSTRGEAAFDVIKPFAIRSRDEIGDLATTFQHMEQELRKSIRKLTETTALKERIESELTIARDIQMSILPKIFPPFPQRSDLDVYAIIEPAREVGGDFYNFFFIDDNRLYFTIGDVAGKGVPASLFMAITQTLIRAHTTNDLLPEEVLTRVNRELCAESDANMFVTIFLGVLDLARGEVWYSNGGHNPPYVLSANGRLQCVEPTGDLVLGIMADRIYHSKRMTLERGDSLVLFTDGVTEAMDEDGNLFSESRLEACLQQMINASPTDLLERVVAEVQQFTKGAPPSDDLATLAIRYR